MFSLSPILFPAHTYIRYPTCNNCLLHKYQQNIFQAELHPDKNIEAESDTTRHKLYILFSDPPSFQLPRALAPGN